ncbi:conserved exported hypothetical protein [uncultured Dysgonomonas sp.]|uniref:Outer membrane protein beta-barrel domain-containing protein n=1 Tax=uncultured Dysgonomonas sp. TaxID=206096 RepID=A0A212JVJ2_9BACT|nr:porin family protein [uncultured Dysgonomonas sp.]SBW03388.1 conserved exported hypothetical protein [uncultured Dysgonomonas sp.]
MKMIARTTLIVAAILLTIGVNAQDKPLTFGVKGGMNISNFSGDFQDTKAKIGFNAGVTLDFALTNDLYLLTGLEFTSKGTKVNEDTNLKMNLSYLQLPVHAGYKLTVANDTRIVFHAGPYIAYAADGKWKVKGIEDSVGVFGDEAEAAGLKMKRFDFGLGFGVGAEFGQFNAGLNCDFGLVNIADFGMLDFPGFGEIDASNVSVKNMNVGISLGYKF